MFNLKRSGLCRALLLLVVPIFWGCEQSSDTKRSVPQGDAGNTSGHERMVDMLKQIAMQSTEKADQADLPTDTSDIEKWRFYMDAARAESYQGNERGTIDLLSKAYELIPSLGDQLDPIYVNVMRFRLGVAHLRVGETQNCCMRNTADSCILPIQGSGIHTRMDGSKEAISYFVKVLNTSSHLLQHLKSKWLLNLAYMTIGAYPDDVPPKYLIPPRVFESEEPFPRFENIAPILGVDTFSVSGGAAVDDFDNDGYLDIISSSWDSAQQIRFFRNEQDGRFSDRTDEVGLRGLLGGLNMIQGDYDNDGDLDFLALRGAWGGLSGPWGAGQAWESPNSLLRNNGDGTFTDVTFEAGLGEVHYPTQTAGWADYDNDGDLDLYIGNEYTKPVPVSCQLFRNNGDGTFTDVAKQAGVENRKFTKGVIWGDYDGDRYPDIYVSNMGSPNRLYHNNGDSTFTDVAGELGVTEPIDSLPVWFWDFNNDGALDIYVPSFVWFTTRNTIAHIAASYMGYPLNLPLASLYRGDGRGGFEEVAQEHNLTGLNLPMGANFGDLDNDGYLDFYLGTGYPDYEALMPNVMYHNKAGQRFTDVTFAGGFGHLQKGHGIVFADLDHDGDQDIFEQMGGAYQGDKYYDALFENPGFGNQWITIKLVGVRSNRSAIGARIRLEVIEEGQRRSIYKHVNSGGSFGANPLRQTIGLGQASKIELLEIYWPTTDLTQQFTDVAPKQFIEVVEDKSMYTSRSLKSFTFPRTRDNQPVARSDARP